ncbi:MAG TPA: hypothetical protein VFX35_12470 [Solirubrobacterales bacterium]|nr:hypothetical protein [Solirubrobacterales bacterium]
MEKRSAYEVRREQEERAKARPFGNLFGVLAEIAEQKRTGPDAAQAVRKAAGLDGR